MSDYNNRLDADRMAERNMDQQLNDFENKQTNQNPSARAASALMGANDFIDVPDRAGKPVRLGFGEVRSVIANATGVDDLLVIATDALAAMEMAFSLLESLRIVGDTRNMLERNIASVREGIEKVS